MNDKALFTLVAAMPAALAPAAAHAQAAKIAVVEAYHFAREDDPALLRAVLTADGRQLALNSADYPPEAVKAGASGPVTVRVTVGTADQIVDCRVIPGPHDTEDATLRARSCELVRSRGRFRHALGLDGTPVEASYDLIFYWEIRDPGAPLFPPAPPPPPSPPDPHKWPVPNLMSGLGMTRPPEWKRFRPAGKPSGEVAIGMVLGRDGTVQACNILRGSGNATLDAATCEAARSASYGVHPVGWWDSRWDSYLLPIIVTWTNGRATHRLPARTASVRPRRASGTATIPPELSAAFERRRGLRVTLDISETGVVTACRLKDSIGSDADDLLLCRHIRDTVGYTPASDVFGLPASWMLDEHVSGPRW